MATKKEFDPYYENVTKTIVSNIKWIKEGPDDISAFRFLAALIIFCVQLMEEVRILEEVKLE